MSDSNSSSESPKSWNSFGYGSEGCIDIIVEGGDFTVRPLTGKDLERNLAERAKIARYKALYGEVDPEPEAIDIVFDQSEADYTVRPLTGKDLERNLAERAKIARYKAMEKEQQGEKPAE